MKLVSWNVNGIRACLQKGFLDFFAEADADVFCVQETKAQPGQAQIRAPGYHQYWFSAEKKGYSGTAVWTKNEPLEVIRGIGAPEYDAEGRVLALRFERFFLVTVYTPNAQRELARIQYRMEFEDALRAWLRGLDRVLPVIVCGDLNVARAPVDLKNPRQNEGSAGYSPAERGKMEELLGSGFADTFRRLYPDREGAYTWWSYMFHARERNAGWRIDYFLCSERIFPAVRDSVIYSGVTGSDHCPVGLILDETF